MRLDFAFLKPGKQLLKVLLILLWLAGDKRTPEDADNRAAFEQWEIERDTWNLACREANHQEPAIPGDTAQRRLGVVAAYRVINNIHPIAAGERFYLLLQVGCAVIDEFISAMLLADCQLCIGGGGGDHMRAHRLTDL